MALSNVTTEQFEWRGKTLVHKPTGAEFSWSYPNSESEDMTINWKEAGNVLPSGEDIDRGDIKVVAVKLLSEKR